jgi:hypothetical protein
LKQSQSAKGEWPTNFRTFCILPEKDSSVFNFLATS